MEAEEVNEKIEPLPTPAAVASPERSEFDENQFKVSKRFSEEYSQVILACRWRLGT